MEIYVSSMCLDGVDSIGENPLPIFRSVNHDKAVLSNGSIPKEMPEGFGKNAGDRMPPYLKQDRYNRDKRQIDFRMVE